MRHVNLPKCPFFQVYRLSFGLEKRVGWQKKPMATLNIWSNFETILFSHFKMATLSLGLTCEPKSRFFHSSHSWNWHKVGLDRQELVCQGHINITLKTLYSDFKKCRKVENAIKATSILTKERGKEGPTSSLLQSQLCYARTCTRRRREKNKKIPKKPKNALKHCLVSC